MSKFHVAYEYPTTVIGDSECNYVHCHGKFSLENTEVWAFDEDNDEEVEFLSSICQEMESEVDPSDWLEAAPLISAWAKKHGLKIRKCSAL